VATSPRDHSSVVIFSVAIAKRNPPAHCADQGELHQSCQTIYYRILTITGGIPIIAKQHSELIRTVDKQKSPEVKLRGILTNKPKMNKKQLNQILLIEGYSTQTTKHTND
jgi:hypothetical protein